MQVTTGAQSLGAQRVKRFLFSDDTQTPFPLLVLGAGLALAIAVIHLQDQGGLLGNQSPLWLKYGYYLVEISSTISAAFNHSREDLRVASRAGVKHRAYDRLHPVAECWCSW